MTYPILVLCYNRADNLQKLFLQLSKLKADNLYISIDGPKNKDDIRAQKKIDLIIDQYSGHFKRFRVRRAKSNRGLQHGVVSGIDWFFKHVGAGIILEDDLQISASFINFCSTLLKRYEDDQRVMLISGNNFFPKLSNFKEDYSFSKQALIWGWATWKDRWQKYHHTVKKASSLSSQANYFKPLLSGMPKNKIKHAFEALKGELDSWAYIWNLAVYLNQGLCIVPAKNLVVNRGFGKDATHTKHKTFHAYLPVSNLKIKRHPSKILPNNRFDLLVSLSDNLVIMLLISIYVKIFHD